MDIICKLFPIFTIKNNAAMNNFVHLTFYKFIVR